MMVTGHLLLLLLVCSECQARVGTFLEDFRHLFDFQPKNVAPTRTNPKKTNRNCLCGQINSGAKGNTKIINGTEVNPPYKYPWMVALKKSERFVCGASIINNRFVLTAKHCITDSDPNAYEVVMGVHDIADIRQTSEANLADKPFAQSSRITHIKFMSTDSLGNSFGDIALLKLKTEVIFTKQVGPICLPKDKHVYSEPPRSAIVTGWGKTENGLSSDVLRENFLRVINVKDCREQSAYGDLLTDDVVCAAAPGKDACQGDSGGPLVIEGATSYAQLGIVSWGRGCALDKYPGVYTSVTSFVNQIYTKTRGGIYCRNPDFGS